MNNNTITKEYIYVPIILVVLSLWLNSCSFTNPSTDVPLKIFTTTPLPTNTTLPTITFTPTIPPTDTPTATIQPTSTATPTSTAPITLSAEVLADTLNIREGPGTTFEILFKLQKGASVIIESRAPGDEWAFIQSSDNQSGWASITFLDVKGDLNNTKIQDIDFAFMVKGKVIDEFGEPVNDINVAVIRNNGTTLRTDARTTDSGEFFAYIQSNNGNEWQVSVVGIGCTSRIVDQDCNFEGKFEPAIITILLPLQKTIEFTYFP